MVNWFGKNWGAPVCRELEWVDTPRGKRCVRCKRRIKQGDEGIVLDLEHIWHIGCFIESVCPSEKVREPSHG